MKIESDYLPDYTAWKEAPSPTTTSKLLKTIQPSIDRGISAHAGQNVSPTLRGQARRLTLDAIKTYDPEKASLGTHVVNNLQRLRRVSRQQNNIISMPERVTMDRAYVHRAEQEFEDEIGRPPSTQELADRTHLSMRRIGHIRKFKMPMAEGSFLGMQTENDDWTPPIEHDNTSIVHQAVYGDLDGVNQQVMEWTLGMYGSPKLSNQQIAAKLGVTPGAVSQRKLLIQNRIDEIQNSSLF